MTWGFGGAGDVEVMELSCWFGLEVDDLYGVVCVPFLRDEALVVLETSIPISFSIGSTKSKKQFCVCRVSMLSAFN